MTVFGKITVIKTLCIPKFTHIATIIPNLRIGQINEIEREFETFLNENNPSVTDTTTRHMSKKDLGLGMPRIDHFGNQNPPGHYYTGLKLNHTHLTP